MESLKGIGKVFAVTTLVGIIMTNCGLTLDSIVTDVTFLIMAMLVPCMLHTFETSSLDKEIKNMDFRSAWIRRKSKLKGDAVLYVQASVLVYFILHFWLGGSILEFWCFVKSPTVKMSAEMTALGFIGGTIGVELCTIAAMKTAKDALRRRLDTEKEMLKRQKDKEKEADL